MFPVQRRSLHFCIAHILLTGFSLAMATTMAITTATEMPDTAAFHLEISPSDSLSSNKINLLLHPSLDSAHSILASLPAYTRVRTTRFGSWDGDSGMLVGSELGRYPQLYRVVGPGAVRQQLTFFTKRMAGFYPNPNPRQKNLLYIEDTGGDEDFHLDLLNLATGKNQNLGCPPGRVEGVFWNDSGTAFVYAHTPKGTDRWDIRLGRADGKDTLLLSLPGTWSPMDLSPDGKYLLVQKYISAADAELHVLSLSDGSLKGSLTPVLPPGQRALSGNALFVPSTLGKNGTWDVCFTSDWEGEFVRLYRVQLGKMNVPARQVPLSQAPASGAPVPLSLNTNWDVEWVSASQDRSLLVYALNEEGISKLYALHLTAKPAGSLKPNLLPGIPEGLIDGVHFRPDSKPSRAFAFTLAGPTFPGEVFTYRMDGRVSKRWTKNESADLPPEAFSRPKLIHFPSFDSVLIQIPAWMYSPNTKSAHAPLPVLILIHGGPESQARPAFDPFIQYAVGQLGLTVIQPNVRGSSGYGKSWQQADDGLKRMASVRDIGALLDWIKTQPDLDSTRIAVAGRSYGGFMALSALIEYGPQGKNAGQLQSQNQGRLRGGISTVGITHFPSFLKKTSGYRRDLRRVEYGDERIPAMAEFLDSISPLTRLNRLQAPLLLCHGRNDPRVPYQESETIAAALKAKQVPVWFLTFEQEGHAFRDQENQLIHYRVMAEFLTKVLDLKPGSALKFRR